jgi:trimethylamine--corrinoid protein Co-methyltransferase
MDDLGKAFEIASPEMRVLTDNQRDLIYTSALEVMDRTGLKIPNSEILEMLKKAGCNVVEDVAHIPYYVVENCLKTVPRKVTLYTREGDPALEIGGENVYFGAGADCTFILDSYTGERRLFAKSDIEQGALLQDALPNIDYVMSMGVVSDVPDSLADIVQFEAMVTNTVKPINFSAFSTRSAFDIIKMATIIAGGEEYLREKPFLFQFGSGSKPPLSFEPSKMERLLIYVDRGIPIVCLSASASGGTAPVTGAGHLISSLAEILTSVVMSQLRVEGAPIMIGVMPLTMDMKTGIFSYAAPEFYLSNSAKSELIRSLGIPVYGTAGCSDAKVIDEQAAIECTMSCLLEALSGTNLIHDVGYLESGMSGSFDMLVMGDEIISLVRRFCKGIKFGKEHLALDVIHSVGHGGNYVMETHTFEHFREEQWQPDLLSREGYPNWLNKGGTTLKERVNLKVRNLLKSHKPVPLNEQKKKEIKKIIESRF